MIQAVAAPGVVLIAVGMVMISRGEGGSPTLRAGRVRTGWGCVRIGAALCGIATGLWLGSVVAR